MSTRLAEGLGTATKRERLIGLILTSILIGNDQAVLFLPHRVNRPLTRDQPLDYLDLRQVIVRD